MYDTWVCNWIGCSIYLYLYSYYNTVNIRERRRSKCSLSIIYHMHVSSIMLYQAQQYHRYIGVCIIWLSADGGAFRRSREWSRARGGGYSLPSYDSNKKAKKHAGNTRFPFSVFLSPESGTYLRRQLSKSLIFHGKLKVPLILKKKETTLLTFFFFSLFSSFSFVFLLFPSILFFLFLFSRVNFHPTVCVRRRWVGWLVKHRTKYKKTTNSVGFDSIGFDWIPFDSIDEKMKSKKSSPPSRPTGLPGRARAWCPCLSSPPRGWGCCSRCANEWRRWWPTRRTGPHWGTYTTKYKLLYIPPLWYRSSFPPPIRYPLDDGAFPLIPLYVYTREHRA